jgi:hypothetical protein
MSIINRILCCAAIFCALAGAVWASALAPQIGGGVARFDGGVSSSGAAPGPPPLGTPITLENGTTPLTMENGTTHICLEGFGTC